MLGSGHCFSGLRCSRPCSINRRWAREKRLQEIWAINCRIHMRNSGLQLCRGNLN